MTALSSVPVRRRSTLLSSMTPSAQESTQSPLRTPVSILGSRTRSALGDDSDGSDSPSKRKKKVAFDMNLNMAVDLGSKSLDEAKREVRKALAGLARGNDEGYDYLKEILGNDRKRYLPPMAGEEDDSLQPEELLVYIVAMTNYAPLLGKSSSGLIKTVLKCAWLGRDLVFVSAYIQFLAALSSAHGPCLAQVLSMLLDKFTLVNPADWTVPDFPPISKDVMKERLHLGLQYLLSVFPAARPILCSLVVSKYPYHEEPKSAHMAYLDNLFRLQRYAPDLERDMMELITNQMVKLDVHMQLDLDDTDDDVTRTVLQKLEARSALTDMDDEDSDDGDVDSVHSDDSDFDEIEQQIISAEKNIRKLDAVLGALFEFYSPYFYAPESADAAGAFSKLLADFTNIILPTSGTRHSQFLLFHFGQKSPQLIDAFLGTLITIAEDSTRPLILRRAAIAYLASFVARGAHLSAGLVQDIARTMWQRMDTYRDIHEHICRGPDLRRFSIYYEWAQGLMYVFCFRWRELIKAVPASVDPDDPASYLDKDLVWMDDLRDAVRRNIRSKFNPLKVCSPSIVEQFAKLALHLGLDYIFPLLDANKSLQLSQVMPSAYVNGSALRDSGYDPEDPKWTHLEVNAQFDPYQLPRSKTWIEGDYIQWSEIPGLSHEEHDQDNDHGSDEDIELADEEALGEESGTDEED